MLYGSLGRSYGFHLRQFGSNARTNTDFQPKSTSPQKLAGVSFLIDFQIQQLWIDSVGINFFDDRVLAIPPAVEINFSAAVAAERLKRLRTVGFWFKRLFADRTCHRLNQREHLSVIQTLAKLCQGIKRITPAHASLMKGNDSRSPVCKRHHKGTDGEHWCKQQSARNTRNNECKQYVPQSNRRNEAACIFQRQDEWR